MPKSETQVPIEVVKEVVNKCDQFSHEAIRKLDQQTDICRQDSLTVAPYDPNELLDLFPGLSMTDGFKLASYQFTSGTDGNGFTFVIPEDRELPDPQGPDWWWEQDLWGVQNMLESQRRPDWIHQNVGSFLKGNLTPISYFRASIMLRALGSLGDVGHGAGGWSEHDILLADPFEDPAKPSASRRHGFRLDDWTWKLRRPLQWPPRILTNQKGHPVVMFYSHTGHEIERMYLSRDTFKEGYVFTSWIRVVATGGAGYIY